MTEYEMIKAEISEIKARLDELKDEITEFKFCRENYRDMLQDSRGQARFEVKDEINYYSNLLDDLYCEKEDLYDRLNHLCAERDKWMSQKFCASCQKPFKFSTEWVHIPSYCPECRRKFKNRN